MSVIFAFFLSFLSSALCLLVHNTLEIALRILVKPSRCFNGKRDGSKNMHFFVMSVDIDLSM